MKLVRRDSVVASSDLLRLEQCPAAGVFRSDEKRKPDFPQWYGIFVHRFLQYAVQDGRAMALEYVYSKNMKSVHKVCERIDVDSLPRGEVEVSLAHNVIEDTGRDVSGRNGIKSMDIGTEQFGRADLLAEDDGFPLIVDYKCGELGDKTPVTSTQLFGLAAALRGALRDPLSLTRRGVDKTPEQYTIALVGVHSSGELEWAKMPIFDHEIDAYVSRARQIHLRVIEDRKRVDAGAQPEFVKGDQCVWCELRPACPAHR